MSDVLCLLCTGHMQHWFLTTRLSLWPFPPVEGDGSTPIAVHPLPLLWPRKHGSSWNQKHLNQKLGGLGVYIHVRAIPVRAWKGPHIDGQGTFTQFQFKCAELLQGNTQQWHERRTVKVEDGEYNLCAIKLKHCNKGCCHDDHSLYHPNIVKPVQMKLNHRRESRGYSRAKTGSALCYMCSMPYISCPVQKPNLPGLNVSTSPKSPWHPPIKNVRA